LMVSGLRQISRLIMPYYSKQYFGYLLGSVDLSHTIVTVPMAGSTQAHIMPLPKLNIMPPCSPNRDLRESGRSR
jgi:hypothetical protein